MFETGGERREIQNNMTSLTVLLLAWNDRK